VFAHRRHLACALPGSQTSGIPCSVQPPHNKSLFIHTLRFPTLDPTFTPKARSTVTPIHMCSGTGLLWRVVKATFALAVSSKSGGHSSLLGPWCQKHTSENSQAYLRETDRALIYGLPVHDQGSSKIVLLTTSRPAFPWLF